jgi:hypothetical protein
MLVKYVNFQLALDNHYANKLPLLIVWLSILNPSSTSLRNIWPVKWNSLQIYLCLARIPFHLLVRWEQALARLADTLQCEQRHPGLILAPTIFPCTVHGNGVLHLGSKKIPCRVMPQHPSSIKLLDHQTNQHLAWSLINDMIHFIV